MADGGGWVITEQVRIVSTGLFRRLAPELGLTDDELATVCRVLSRTLLL